MGAVNHAAVFPACRAVVHHGGAGTTAAGMRAAVPTLILWVGADQPVWATQVKRLKVGISALLEYHPGPAARRPADGARTSLHRSRARGRNAADQVRGQRRGGGGPPRGEGRRRRRAVTRHESKFKDVFAGVGFPPWVG